MHSAHTQSIEEVKVVNRFTHATAPLISVQDADAAQGYLLYRALVLISYSLRILITM